MTTRDKFSDQISTCMRLDHLWETISLQSPAQIKWFKAQNVAICVSFHIPQYYFLVLSLSQAKTISCDQGQQSVSMRHLNLRKLFKIAPILKWVQSFGKCCLTHISLCKKNYACTKYLLTIWSMVIKWGNNSWTEITLHANGSTCGGHNSFVSTPNEVIPLLELSHMCWLSTHQVSFSISEFRSIIGGCMQHWAATWPAWTLCFAKIIKNRRKMLMTSIFWQNLPKT